MKLVRVGERVLAPSKTKAELDRMSCLRCEGAPVFRYSCRQREQVPNTDRSCFLALNPGGSNPSIPFTQPGRSKTDPQSSQTK